MSPVLIFTKFYGIYITILTLHVLKFTETKLKYIKIVEQWFGSMWSYSISKFVSSSDYRVDKRLSEVLSTEAWYLEILCRKRGGLWNKIFQKQKQKSAYLNHFLETHSVYFHVRYSLQNDFCFNKIYCNLMQNSWKTLWERPSKSLFLTLTERTLTGPIIGKHLWSFRT